LIAGLVASSGDAGNCECWAAVVIGIFAGIFYYSGTLLIEKVKIDDPCQAWYLGYLSNGIS
jgi:ammonia channel protein AmtB